MVKDYYRLTKPGIVYGNAITAAAGFFVASRGRINLLLGLEMLFGISLVIASACVYNNYIDRNIDRQMDRTKNRALAAGRIKSSSALIYASILGFVGLSLLAMTNLLTAAIGFAGMVVYVLIYALAKRRSRIGTLVGSVAGAVPPVVGYTAVTGHLDLGAAILFVMLVIWQMPHFYAISLVRQDEYKAAGIPTLPGRLGQQTTKQRIFAYIFVFILAAVSLNLFGYTGFTYRVVAILLGIAWLYKAARGLGKAGDRAWAKQMYRLSLLVLTTLCVVMSIDAGHHW